MSSITSLSPPECEPGGTQGGVLQAQLGPPSQNQCPDINQKSKRVIELSVKDKSREVLSEGLCSDGIIESKGRRSPRPPVPGGEDLQPSHHSSDWGKPAHHYLLPQLDYSHFHGGEGGGDGLAVVGSVEGGSPCCGGGEGGSTPPPVRWSESLTQLLDDPSGIHLFTEYLKEECGSCEALHFWFACNGLRKDHAESPTQIVTIIWKRFIRNYTVKISAKTYAQINDRINARAIDKTIFDLAQEEVEEEISRSTYPSFLKSERYLNYLASLSNPAGGLGGDSPQTSESSPNSPPMMINTVGQNGSSVLPTLHEERELEGTAPPLRLTMGALQATARHRERLLPESMAGQYLHGSHQHHISGGVNPYHAQYASAQVVSRQDSELQSLSSDALTDDTHSCTDSSLDGVPIGVMRPPNPKQLKRQYYRARENARQNRELALSAAMPGQNFTGMSASHQMSQSAQAGAILLSGVPFLPRTHRIPPQAMPKNKPDEFAAKLIEKLEKVKRDRESQEKVQQSFKKIQEGDNVTDEYRREHAYNSLPPMVLLDKLAQKLSLEDQDPSQAILDEHVSRVFAGQDSNNDSGARSPGSPGGTTSRQQQQKTLQLAQQQLLLPRQQNPLLQTHHRKGVVGSSVGAQPQLQFPSMYMVPGSGVSAAGFSSSSSSKSYQQQLPQQPTPGHPYQMNKRWPHRTRDRGPDVYSTFSSDSGNVADYYDSQHLPKSRSMPDTMIDYAGTSSDGGSSGRRGSNSRRVASRRHHPDLTDSGVSVVSDSGPSLTPSTSSTERVSSWLMESDKYSSGSGGSMCNVESGRLPRGCRSSPHTAAGATSPGTLRRSSNRRTGGGGSVSGCVGRSGSLERSINPWPPQSILEPLDPAYHPGVLVHPGHPATYMSHHVPTEDKRRRSGVGHGSSRTTVHGSGHGELSSSGTSAGHIEGGNNVTLGGSGSNVSTLRKQQQQRTNRHSTSQGVGLSENSGGIGGSGGVGGGSTTLTTAAAVTESTTTVFKYHDDSEPYVTRIPTSQVTLKRFKQSLPKKGNYRFFFKKQCEEFGIIQEEITDENEVLPLFEGKIFAQIRKAD